MQTMADEREVIQCTKCKKRFHADGFRVNRLGRRNKTCLECAERRVRELERVRVDPERYERWKAKKRAANARYFERKRAQEVEDPRLA